MLRIYLAGAIRAGYDVDLKWRDEAVKKLKLNYDVFSPTAGKSWTTEGWKLLGEEPSGKQIVKQDFWMVDNCDIVLSNLTALGEGYPCIGTLIELGRATANEALIYAVVPKGFQHPFVEENAAKIFNTVEQAVEYLVKYVYILNGMAPENGMTEINERMQSDLRLVGELENDDLKIGGTDAD